MPTFTCPHCSAKFSVQPVEPVARGLPPPRTADDHRVREVVIELVRRSGPVSLSSAEVRARYDAASAPMVSPRKLGLLLKDLGAKPYNTGAVRGWHFPVYSAFLQPDGGCEYVVEVKKRDDASCLLTIVGLAGFQDMWIGSYHDDAVRRVIQEFTGSDRFQFVPMFA